VGEQSGQLVRLSIQPGMVTDETDVGAGAMGTWKDGNLVRFKNGLAQSLGGWVQQVLTGETLLGIPRSNHDWVALDGTKYVVVGTEKRLYIIEQDLTVTNITPIRDSGVAGLTNPFSTSTAGAYDPNVTGDPSYFNVNDVGHGCTVGDIVNFANFTSPVGGIEVNGDFEVISVTDSDNYVLKGATDATSTVSGGGGTGDYIYEITVGSGSTGVASGWGTGPWGEETWGTPRSGSTYVLELRTWSLDNWGEDLIASPRGGKIYQWDKSGGLGTRAQVIATAPDTNLRVFVSPENRQMISLGAHNGTTQDPLFIAWTDNEDFTTWIPAVDNTAGDKRLDQGSEIVTGLPTRVGIIVWTDKSVHAMQPTGGNEIYSFRQLASGISIAGPSAATDANGVVYFMGRTNFYVFDGVLRVLPCPVWTRIFDPQRAESLNQSQSFSTFCSHSKDFNEVWWFYPSTGESLNDLYVVYNYVEQVWYFGSMDRASFHDFSPFFDKPFGFDAAGTLYTHEDGDDADGMAMDSFIESGDMTIADGDQLMHVSKMIPDFDRQVGDVSLTLKGRKYPQKAQFTKGPYTSSTTTDQLSVRIRARQIAIRVDQSVLGGSFRMGSWASRMVSDGER
jgi:hypothetical protein